MSNSMSPPISMLMDQLQSSNDVSKCGLSSKGIHKEVAERLMEASKEEKHDGSEFTEKQEAAPVLDATDEHEEFEGKEDVARRRKEELLNMSEFSEAANGILSKTLPGVLGLSSEGAAPSHEFQKPSIVSASDGVRVVSEAREPCFYGGSVETNNDVLFVNNAGHENGYAVFSPENAPGTECSPAHAQESGKETNSVVRDTNNSEIPENFANNLMSDVKVGGIVDAQYKQNASKEAADPVISKSFQNLEPHAEEMNVAASSNGFLVDQHCKLEGLSEIAVQIPIPVISPCPEALTTQAADELARDLVAAKPTAGERYTVIKSDMPIVQSDDVGKQEDVEMAKAGQPDWKMEPSERSSEAASKKGYESQIGKDSHCQKILLDAEQMKIEQDPSYDDKTCGEDSRSEVVGLAREVVRDIVDSSFSEDAWQAHGNMKRDIEFKPQEPAKRMRRWASGNQVAINTVEPLTSGDLKKMMPRKGSTVLSEGISPRLVATSRSLPPKVKADSERNDSPRIVPPSTRPPSNSLKVERFIRPFTLKAVKDMLAEFGECTDFWMDQIKTHCFVSYSSVEEAIAARNGLCGRQWPPSVGNFLIADYVDSTDVKIRLAGLPEKTQVAPAVPPSRTPHLGRAPFQGSPPRPSLFRNDSSISQMPSFSRQGQYPSAPPEPAAPTLDDLFFKTKSRPHIYYLPLTKEQVAEKLRIRQGFEQGNH